jgi:ketosteroid isomerase-like protein
MSREENVELVRAGYDAFNQRDFDAALERADEGITWRPFFSLETELLAGKQAIRVAWENQAETLDLRIHIEEMTALDDTHVLAVGTWVGHGSGSGARVEQTIAQLFTVVAGKLRSVESYTSRDAAVQAAIGSSDRSG